MNKKKIMWLGILIITFLIIFGIVYLLNKKDNNLREKYQQPEPEVIPYNMSTVNDYSYFFSVVNTLNSYLNYIKDHNTDALLSILHQEYNVDKNNLYQNLGLNTDGLQLTFKARHMAYKTYDDRYLYYVKGDVIVNNFSDNKVLKENAMFLVNIDYENITYAIYPLNNIQKNLPIKHPENEIKANSYNTLIGSNVITKDYICNLYLNDFISNINDDISKSYDLLNNDFRRKNFNQKSKYIDYMNNNKNKLSSKVYSCSLLSGKDHIYEVKDMNFNVYTFVEESIMNYKVEFELN